MRCAHADTVGARQPSSVLPLRSLVICDASVLSCAARWRAEDAESGRLRYVCATVTVSVCFCVLHVCVRVCVCLCGAAGARAQTPEQEQCIQHSVKRSNDQRVRTGATRNRWERRQSERGTQAARQTDLLLLFRS